MLLKRLLYLLVLCSTCLNILTGASVSYRFSGGRFGDNLLTYAHAVWVSYKLKIPLLYRPFKQYSDQLALSRIHNSWEVAKDQFDQVIGLTKKGAQHRNLFDLNIDDTILYMVPFFGSCAYDIQLPNCGPFDVDWRDEGFVNELRRGISPLNILPSLEIPEDRIAVGIHLRTGGGADNAIQLRQPADKKYPFKFPPNSFFIEQIKHMSELLNDQPMYVHIFTDSKRPEYFAKLFEQEVNKPNIIYGFREKSGVLEDFFAMTAFRYFIRGESHFSFMAGVLARFEICIIPTKYAWKSDREMIITEIQVQKRKDREFTAYSKSYGSVNR